MKPASEVQEAKLKSYVLLMEEIKTRQTAIGHYLDGTRSGLYPATTAESVGLQFRKIFELIAFGCLLMNKEAYSAAFPAFKSDWALSQIVKNLSKVNPDFYPKPMLEKRSWKPSVKNRLVPRKDDFLSVKELVEAHGKCGDLLHTRNPFKPETNYESFWKLYPRWQKRTINLLNDHKLVVAHFDGFYLIHMKEELHEQVSYYAFGRKTA